MTAGTLQQTPFVDRFLGVFGLARKSAPSAGVFYPAMHSTQVANYPQTFPGWPDRQTGVNAAKSDEQRARISMMSAPFYSNVTVIANEFAAANLFVQTRQDGQWVGNEEADDHPLERVWQAPNPFMGHSFIAAYWMWSRYLTGEAYLFFAPGPDGLPVEIWPVPAFLIEPIPHNDKFIDGYLFKARDADGRIQPLKIEPQYICYSRIPHPFDPRRGLSPLSAAFPEIENDLAMARWNRDFFGEKNAVPSGIAVIPKDVSEADYQRARSELFDFFGGGQRRLAVVRSGDLDWKHLGFDPEKMQFTSLRDKSSRLIDRAMGFPGGYWNENATEANARGAKAIVIEQIIWPTCVAFSEDLNAQIIPYHYGPDQRAIFEDIRPRNRELDLREFQAYSTILTVDELRDKIGKQPIGDVRGSMLLAEIQKGMPTEGGELAEPELAAPVEATDIPEADMGDVEEVKAVSIDLRRWQRKALAALKAGKPPAVKFASDIIPAAQRAAVADALARASTADEVRAAFKAEEEKQDTDTLIASEWEAALDWAKKVMG